MGKQDILFHTYAGKPSSVGGTWVQILKANIAQDGFRVHDVSSPTADAEAVDRMLSTKPSLIILYWRWPMDERRYPDRQQAYERQLDLLDYAIDSKTSVLIFDGDLQPGAEEATELLRMAGCNVKLAAPMLFPKRGYIRLMYPMSHRLPTFVPKMYDFCYIGNNYGRYEEMVEVLSRPFFEGKRNHVFGNWLNLSDEREKPEQVKVDFPYVNFNPPVPPESVTDLLARARFTYHFGKPEYNECGFMTMRWQEAASAGCLGLATDCFRLTSSLETAFRLSPQKAYVDPMSYASGVVSQYRLIEYLCQYRQWSPVLRDLTGVYR